MAGWRHAWHAVLVALESGLPGRHYPQQSAFHSLMPCHPLPTDSRGFVGERVHIIDTIHFRLKALHDLRPDGMYIVPIFLRDLGFSQKVHL